jgi:hypothetical protein
VPPEAVTSRVRSHAFGLDLESEREIVGLPPVSGPPRGPLTRIDFAENGGLGKEAQGEPVRVVRGADREVTLAVHLDPAGNYLLTLPGTGAYRVTSDGLRVTCFPEAGLPDWRWQRAIVNQVLPLAATLRGFEVMHAGAVGAGGRALALVGHPGAGKSSTTLNLILQGATFFTDDALAIERGDGGLLAHPGAAVSNFPRTERDLMQAGESERLGSVIGGDGEFKSLLALERREEPLPLGALYFLHRGSPGESTEFEPVTDAGPSLLLGSTYVLSVRSPVRLANQLDLCAEISREIPIFDVLIPATVTARESAAALLAHSAQLGEPSS